MAKVTVKKIIMYSQALDVLAVDEKGNRIRRDLPATLSYWLKRLGEKIKPIKEAFEKSQMELFEKYGDKKEKKDGEPESWLIKKENVESFKIEINGISEQEEEFIIDPVSISLFGGEKIPVEFFILMDDLIVD